jgi:hypothetical protein
MTLYIQKNKSTMGFLGNLFNKVKSGVSKALGVGGSVLRRVGEVGGKVTRWLGNNASTIGTLVGGGLSLLPGGAAVGLPLMVGSQAVGNFAKSKPVQNVVRGINDVGQAATQGAQYLNQR